MLFVETHKLCTLTGAARYQCNSLYDLYDRTDPTYTIENFLKAITANMVMTVGPEKTDSPYHDAWILKRIAMIQKQP